MTNPDLVNISNRLTATNGYLMRIALEFIAKIDKKEKVINNQSIDIIVENESKEPSKSET